MEPEPPFFGSSWSRPNLVGAGVGAGTSDFRSRSRQKKWRLRNTALNSIKNTFLHILLHLVNIGCLFLKLCISGFHQYKRRFSEQCLQRISCLVENAAFLFSYAAFHYIRWSYPVSRWPDIQCKQY